jgi:hypothetical protein
MSLRATPSALRTLPGTCAKCNGAVYESVDVLDDCYAVWMGRCPHCQALNFLSTRHGRGYDSKRMHLVLPTPEEIANNQLPADTSTAPPAPAARVAAGSRR